MPVKNYEDEDDEGEREEWTRDEEEVSGSGSGRYECENQKEEPRTRTYKKVLWLSDITDNFNYLKNYYSGIDYRLKWIDMSDILYGSYSDYKISHDNDINEFISKFLNEIDYLKKKCQLVENRINLNRKKVYSRISYCIQKRYVL